MSEVSNSHPSNIFWIPVDIAVDVLSAGAHVVETVVKGAGHTLAEGARDISGDQTAFGGDIDATPHRRNILWLPLDLVTGTVQTGAIAAHHVVKGVANSVVDVAHDVVGTVKD